MALTDYIDVSIFCEPIYAALLAFLITIIAKYIDDTYIIKTKCKLVRHLKTCFYVGALVGIFVYLCKYGMTTQGLTVAGLTGMTGGAQPIAQTTSAQLNSSTQPTTNNYYVGSLGEPIYLDLNKL